MLTWARAAAERLSAATRMVCTCPPSTLCLRVLIPRRTQDDGIADCVDGCPYDAHKKSPGDCGCGVAEQDTDGDKVNLSHALTLIRSLMPRRSQLTLSRLFLRTYPVSLIPPHLPCLARIRCRQVCDQVDECPKVSHVLTNRPFTQQSGHIDTTTLSV